MLDSELLWVWIGQQNQIDIRILQAKVSEIPLVLGLKEPECRILVFARSLGP